MFCPECGHKIEEKGARFCPECGTDLGVADIPDVNVPDANVTDENIAGLKINPASAKGSSSETLYGLIFTNVGLLADKLDVESSDLEKLLDDFIAYKKEYGVNYRLIDAGNYTFARTGLFSRERTVHLDSDSPVEDYMEILLDVHEKEEKKGKDVSTYLFIIGGNDIIPMPVIRHYVQKDGNSDKDIDTDLPYSLPYGRDVLAKLESMDAFRYDQLFFIGRLPLGTDATPEDLVGYLQRDLDNSSGIPLNFAYGQCDPNWKNVSARVASELVSTGLLLDLEGKLVPGAYYNRLMLSPMISAENVSKVLNRQASLYYFNVHGGRGMNMPEYYGQSLQEEGGNWYTVFSPQHIAACREANGVVCEACYGAKFIGCDKRHSMVLSAMSASTLLFLGSSRVAWGSVDHSGATPSTASVGFADIIANTYLGAVLRGYTAGEAFLEARRKIFGRYEFGEPVAAATVVEFNLFGDPTLRFSAEGGISKDTAFPDIQKSIVEPDAEMKVASYEPVARPEGESVLDMVRNAVNANINDMHSMIARHLYSNYKVNARKPESIFRLKYTDGSEEYRFTYMTGSHDDGGIKSYITVSSDPEGKINNVFSTK